MTERKTESGRMALNTGVLIIKESENFFVKIESAIVKGRETGVKKAIKSVTETGASPESKTFFFSPHPAPSNSKKIDSTCSCLLNMELNLPPLFGYAILYILGTIQ